MSSGASGSSVLEPSSEASACASAHVAKPSASLLTSPSLPGSQVTTKASADRDYRLTPEDVIQFERMYGTITRGTIVLLRTGWSRHWPDAKAYLGDDTPGDASKLSFPSFGEDAGGCVYVTTGMLVRVW